MIYNYECLKENLSSSPLQFFTKFYEDLREDINASDITDKSYEDFSLDMENEILSLTFTNELSSEDKTILDGLIAKYLIEG